MIRARDKWREKRWLSELTEGGENREGGGYDSGNGNTVFITSYVSNSAEVSEWVFNGLQWHKNDKRVKNLNLVHWIWVPDN